LDEVLNADVFLFIIAGGGVATLFVYDGCFMILVERLSIFSGPCIKTSINLVVPSCN
jgi:hypothetical protein